MNVCNIGTGGALTLLLLLAGCSTPSDGRVQGYVEGEFVYVAAPLGGTVETVAVERGAQVNTGDLLFVLDSVPERAARKEAEGRLLQARAQLEDARKGKRPSEIDALEAQLAQARAALAFSEPEVLRQERLLRTDATATQEVERARSQRDQDRQRVAQLEAELRTARLGARSDAVAAAEANVRALEAAVARADWELAQKRQTAPAAGLVFDTLFREGEWAGPGRPVVALLPPANIKVRAFVPQTRIGAVRVGEAARIALDGVAGPIRGKVGFISPRAEFTPPVIYSQESRAKLVFMIEIVFEPAVAANLHPGQPVDVYLEP